MPTKLTITPCTMDKDGNISVASKKLGVELMLNPTSYSQSYEIAYAMETAMGRAGQQPKFTRSGKENINFDIVIDGTGVVPVPKADQSLGVTQRLNKLMDVVYNYLGTSHQPNVVQLLWGSLLFYGRLKTMSVDYTLFKPSGEPLRAKVKLAFVDYVSSKEETLQTNKTSPDLTHIVDVKAGDSLPLLCYRIYRDSAYYLEVARSNGITNFRDLKPGTKLHFPPLR